MLIKHGILAVANLKVVQDSPLTAERLLRLDRVLCRSLAQRAGQRIAFLKRLESHHYSFLQFRKQYLDAVFEEDILDNSGDFGTSVPLTSREDVFEMETQRVVFLELHVQVDPDGPVTPNMEPGAGRSHGKESDILEEKVFHLGEPHYHVNIVQSLAGYVKVLTEGDVVLGECLTVFDFHREEMKARSILPSANDSGEIYRVR